jgi:hypothetical protein
MLELLCVVRVPSLEQEQERSLSRQRETLAKERKCLQNVGTSSGLYHGVEVPPNWKKPTRCPPNFCATVIRSPSGGIIHGNLNPAETSEKLRQLGHKLIGEGAPELTAADKNRLLNDPGILSQLHQEVWTAPQASLPAWWRLAMSRYNRRSSFVAELAP